MKGYRTLVVTPDDSGEAIRETRAAPELGQTRGKLTIAINLLSDPTFGVTMARPTTTVTVGISGKNPKTHAPPIFESETVSKAIFDTGWDGDIVIAASTTGEKVVQTK